MSHSSQRSITRLPVEVLSHIIIDTGLLEVEDVFNFIRTTKYFYLSFRYALFHSLALGRPTLYLLPDGTRAPPSDSYTFFPNRSYLTGARLHKFLTAVHEGSIGQTELGWVRYLALSPEVCQQTLIYNEQRSETQHSSESAEPSAAPETEQGGPTTTPSAVDSPKYRTVARKMCMEMKNLSSLYIRALGWPKNSINEILGHGSMLPFIAQMRDCIGLLYYFPQTQLDFHLETASEEILREVLKHKFIRMLSLNFETVKAENQESIEEAIIECKDLEVLRVKAMNPWSEKNTEVDAPPVMKMPQLNNDIPNLRKLILINSPNFWSLPESLEVLEIEIGEFDEISHNCWPTMSMLPRLRKLYMLNNQVTLPRYPHNPYATPIVPIVGFTTMISMHAEIPRPEQKVFFVPPKVLVSLARYNPGLRHVFMPCVAKGDLAALKEAECRTVLRSLEIQTDVMRSTMGEIGFETEDMVKLFDHPGGLPKLEILKWACGGRRQMALTPQLARAMVKRTSKGDKKHNLKVFAIENRVPKPISGRNDVSAHPTFEEDPFSTIQRLRRSLAVGCVATPGFSTPSTSSLSCCYNSEAKKFHKISPSEPSGTAVVQPHMSSMQEELVGCLKPVKLTYPGEGDPYTMTPKELIDAGMDIEHEGLTIAESEYLKKWRNSGGNFLAVTEHGKENNGRILKDTTGIWEDLFFVDMERLETFVKNWGSSIGN